MRFADVDYAAVSGTSLLHQVSPSSKLVATGLCIAAVVISSNVLIVAALALAVLAAGVAARADLRTLLAAAAYPAFFALVFAFATGGGVALGALIVTKAVCAALVVILLTLTTPYPQVIAPLQRLLPPLVGDALLFTYRSFFLVAEKASRLATAARLRAGIRLRSPRQSLLLASRTLGGLVVYAMDLTQRDYDAMRLRGYEGRLRTGPASSGFRRGDVLVLAAATVGFAAALAFSLAPAELGPYSWLPAALAVTALATAGFIRLVSPSQKEDR